MGGALTLDKVARDLGLSIRDLEAMDLLADEGLVWPDQAREIARRMGLPGYEPWSILEFEGCWYELMAQLGPTTLVVVSSEAPPDGVEKSLESRHIALLTGEDMDKMKREAQYIVSQQNRGRDP